MEESLDKYRRLVRRLDQHCEAVSAHHAKDLACAPGCAACCHRQLSVFAIEAEQIRRWLTAQGLAPFESDVTRSFGSPSLLLATDDAPCAFLDAAGRCRIYPVRPVICRSHGLPVALADESGGLRGDCCPLNFRDGLEGVTSDEFLSLETLNTLLAALNRAFVGEDPKLAAAGRIELRDLALAAQQTDGST